MKKINRHILFLVAAMFVSLFPVFHHNLWFDEAYSVGMASQSFHDIYSIGIHDVHPLLYYDLLHIFSWPFADKILAERLFSWMALCLTSLIGYFVIRKYYEENSAFLYGLLIILFPCNVVYAGEIRMYTLVMLFVTLAAIYGDQIIHENTCWKVRIWFSLFCILSAYTHYYGLLAAAVMNLLILISDIKRHHLKQWFMMAIVEIAAYLSWLPVLYNQTRAVQQNFWVEWKWPDSFMAMIAFVFTGNLDETVYMPAWCGILFGVLVISCMVYALVHYKRGVFYLLVYGGVILISAAASIALHRVIVYPRYLLVIQGCLLTSIALNCSLDKFLNRILIFSLCIFGLFSSITLARYNYNPEDQKVQNALENEFQPGDQILLSNTGQNANSFAFFEETGVNKAFYLNTCEWSEESITAYRALGSFTVIDKSDLQKMNGRIWYIFAADEKKKDGQYEDVQMLNKIFDAEPVQEYHAYSTYKGFYYGAYLYQLNH